MTNIRLEIEGATVREVMDELRLLLSPESDWPAKAASKAAPAPAAKAAPAPAPAPASKASTPPPVMDDEAAVMNAATARATELIASGKTGSVREALQEVGVRRVSELDKDTATVFLQKLADV